MPLKALDLVVCLELARRPGLHRTYADLAREVGLSASETNQAVQRALDAGLLIAPADPREKPRANVSSLLEFLEHGARYAYFVRPGSIVRGIPTGRSAAPLVDLIQPSDEPPLVWPDAHGPLRGQAVEPLYRSVPGVAQRNPQMYELLALVDALRCGNTRERKLALAELERRIVHAAEH